MSSRVTLSAVAVKAPIGTSGKSSRSLESCSYSGRKLWPHWEMQCASSTTNMATGRAWSARSMGSVISRSGDM